MVTPESTTHHADMSRLLIMVTLLVALPQTAGSRSAAAEQVVLSGPTMGTTYHVKFVPKQPREAYADLPERIHAVLEEINGQMSTYRTDSEVSRFNRAPADEWFSVSSATAMVAATALEISRQTDGALDVTVGPLVRLWHFGPPADELDETTRTQLKPPNDEALQAAIARVGYQKLAVRHDPPALKKSFDALEIDLSSVAGGFVVDRVAEVLIKSGVTDYLVEVGGEMRGSGQRTDGKDWKVAIESPLPNRRELFAAMPLRNAAIATSGDYRNYFEYQGHRYSHIIDPTTGRPVEHALASVSVVADSCLMADAWDTALVVLGSERGFEMAEEHGITALFISRDKDGQRVRVTSAWFARFGTAAP